MVDTTAHDVEIFRAGTVLLWRRKLPWSSVMKSETVTVILQRGNSVRVRASDGLHSVQTSSLRVAS